LHGDGGQIVAQAIVDLAGQPVALLGHGQRLNLNGVGAELAVGVFQLSQQLLSPLFCLLLLDESEAGSREKEKAAAVGEQEQKGRLRVG
jgi:hypothetical protein